jgi:hypothetical protein
MMRSCLQLFSLTTRVYARMALVAGFRSATMKG